MAISLRDALLQFPRPQLASPLDTSPTTSASVEKNTSDANPPESTANTECATCKDGEWLRRTDGSLVECPTCKAVERRRFDRIQQYDKMFAFRPPLSELRLASLLPHPQRAAALAAARRFVAQPNGWLYLYGTYGDGKTYLVAATVNDLRAAGHLAIFCVVPKMLNWLRAAFEQGSGRSHPADLQWLCDAPVLALDDLDAQKPTEWGDEQLYNILDERYRSHRPTIITSNTPPTEYREPRLASRFGDDRLVHALDCGLKDLRRLER